MWLLCNGMNNRLGFGLAWHVRCDDNMTALLITMGLGSFGHVGCDNYMMASLITMG